MVAIGKFSKPRQDDPAEQEFAAAYRQVTQNPSAPIAPQGKEKKRRGKTGIVIGCVILALLLAAAAGYWYIFIYEYDDGCIVTNVTAAGVNLGGMTPEEASAALHQAVDGTYTQQDMVVSLPGDTLTFSPGDTGAALDVDAVVEAAYQYGRSGTKAENTAAKALAQTEIQVIPLEAYLTLDTDFIHQQLESYASRHNTTYSPSAALVEGQRPALDAEAVEEGLPGQTLVLTLGTPGQYVDMELVYAQVMEAYNTNSFEVTVTTDGQIEYPDALDLEALHSQYCVEPVSAEMDMETFLVTPEVYGYGFDLEEAQQLLDQAFYGDVLEIPFSYITPEVLGSQLEEVLFRDVLAEYQTEHTNNANRNTNLTLACAAINGMVLNPGDVFDYNTALGKRTTEAGYKAADAYDGGRTVSTVGGGICQVSSTLYYCTLIADLKIEKRTPHSYVSSYMPMGMDATVSWGGPEFSFSNNTNYPIRIEAEVSDGYVKVKLIGTDEKDYYIEMEYEVLATYSPGDVQYEEFTADNNPNRYKDGQTIQTAYTGYKVQTYKLKYSKETGELIVREEDQISTYKKRARVVAKLVASTETPPEDDGSSE